MASYAQSFRYTTARYNVSRTRIDMARRPALSSLRAAFKEGEVRRAREGAESPVDPHRSTIVIRSGEGGVGEQKKRAVDEKEEYASRPRRDPEMSWYDDSISEDREGDGYQHDGLLEQEEEVFELEGDFPDTHHQPQVPVHHLHDTVFELEAIGTPQPNENQTDTCRSRRRSYPQCQRHSCIGQNVWDIRYYREGQPVFLLPSAVDRLSFDGHKAAVEQLRYWFASDDYPEWTFDTAANHENIKNVSQLDRMEKRLRRSLSFTRRRGNEVWNCVRSRARSGAVASFFQSSLITVGAFSTL